MCIYCHMCWTLTICQHRRPWHSIKHFKNTLKPQTNHISSFCPAALGLSANLFDFPLFSTACFMSCSFLWLCSVPFHLTHWANQSFTTSFPSCPPSFFFRHSSFPSLPEKTEPDGVYDPITAWTHSWLVPHGATNTHTQSHSISAVGAGMAEQLASFPVISH